MRLCVDVQVQLEVEGLRAALAEEQEDLRSAEQGPGRERQAADLAVAALRQAREEEAEVLAQLRAVDAAELAVLQVRGCGSSKTVSSAQEPTRSRQPCIAGCHVLSTALPSPSPHPLRQCGPAQECKELSQQQLAAARAADRLRFKVGVREREVEERERDVELAKVETEKLMAEQIAWDLEASRTGGVA
jgi:hypothetical protein